MVSRSWWVFWYRAGQTCWLNWEIQTQWGVSHETIGFSASRRKMTALQSFCFSMESELLCVFCSQVGRISRHTTQSRLSSFWLLSLPIVILLLLDWQLKILDINYLLTTNWNVSYIDPPPIWKYVSLYPRSLKNIKVYLLVLTINSTTQ